MKKFNPVLLYIPLFLFGLTTIASKNIQPVNATATLQCSQTRDNYIGWRYEKINGILYKRLYNYTTNCWIGDWIPV